VEAIIIELFILYIPKEITKKQNSLPVLPFIPVRMDD
jgi:hypothetical protein